MTLRFRPAPLARLLVAVVAFVLVGLVCASPGLAASPWWSVASNTRPTELPSEGNGTVLVNVTNIGDASAQGAVTIVDTLPKGVEAKSVVFHSHSLLKPPADFGTKGPYASLHLCSVTASRVSCTYRSSRELEEAGVSPTIASVFSNPMAPFFTGFELVIAVKLTGEAQTGAENEVAVSGGGAPPRTLTRPLRFGLEPEERLPFGVADFELRPEEEGGALDSRAGSHPFQVTSYIAFNQTAEALPAQLPKNIEVRLPAGFAGELAGRAQCDVAEFDSETCPSTSVIGAATFVNNAAVEAGADLVDFSIYSVYNMVPATGEPARFGIGGPALPIILDTSLRSGRGEDYGVTVSSLNTTEVTGLLDSEITFWGNPGDPRHDLSRGQKCVEKDEGCLPRDEQHSVPLLTLPTYCPGSPFSATMDASSWLEPLAGPHPGAEYIMREAAGDPLALSGCNHIPFAPQLHAEPSSDAASSPTGLGFEINFDDEGLKNPEGLAESQIKKTVVTLPEGFTANPSVATGLEACSLARYESTTVDSTPGTGCPEQSKIGTVEIESPEVEQKLTGGIYLAKQNENPFPNPSLLALYIVAKSPELGIVIKVAGKIEANPITGQLVTTFDDIPQQPFTHFKLSFRQGQRAPLITPAGCGTYAVEAEFYPWSNPTVPLHEGSDFQITTGSEDGACPSGGVPPFHPRVAAGTVNDSAGSYSPLDIHIERSDSEQEITGFSSQLPPGLTANLIGVPFCSEADIALAKTKTGAQEQAEPSCPAASEIGRTLVGVGVGTVLAYTPGKVYMAGPFEGAPFSVVAITSATVGPFDLGTVVVHLPLRINPNTAQVSIPTGPADQIPHIIDGIVVHVRDIRVYIERPGFTLNPTSCEPLTFSATVVGSGKEFANPADDVPVTVNDHFQAANCATLAFKPSFVVSTSGTTSRADGASLSVKLTYPAGSFGKYANIKEVKVDLPKQLPSRLTTLQKACSDGVFEANPAACPALSIVGRAKALTPILPVPLEGPAYFVSHGGAKFPELIVVLQGYGVTIELHGETFINKAGITSSTFRTVPDQPVESFELTLPQGPDSALAANGDLCTSTLQMPTAFVAQNGAEIHQSTPIAVTGCKPAITVVSHSVKGVKATILARVPSAGRLVASGAGLSRAGAEANTAGTVTIDLTLSKSERSFLRLHPGRKLEVAVKLLFTAAHKRALSDSVKLLMG